MNPPTDARRRTTTGGNDHAGARRRDEIAEDVIWDTIGAVAWAGMWTLLGRVMGRTVDVADNLEAIDSYALLALLAVSCSEPC